MNYKIIFLLFLFAYNLNSQNLCGAKYAKIIKENSNTYTLESNLKPIKIEWKIKDSIYSTKETTNYTPKDSIVQLSTCVSRQINHFAMYLRNLKNTYQLFPDSFIPLILDYKNSAYIPKMLHSSRRRFQVINNRVFLNIGVLFEYKNGLYHYIKTDSFYNRFIYRQAFSFYIRPYNQILHYSILNEDIIGDYLLDSSITYLYYSSKKFNHFYYVNLNSQAIDSIPYIFKSKLKPLKSDMYILHTTELDKKCAITKMQFLNKDSILFSDSCFLGLLDLKNKTTKTLYKFSNEIIHFNTYKKNVYFLNNFNFYYQAQDSFTKFFYYKFDVNKLKLDSTEIVLQGKIDSSSFIVDAYNNITCIRYENTANPDSSYNTSIIPHKRWANLVQFNISNVQNQKEYPTIENNLKHQITSWDAETNLQMDCNGDILFQGTKENDTLIYLYTPPHRWNDSIDYRNESLCKIIRKIDNTFQLDSCEQIEAVVYFADGDTLHTIYTPHCGYIYKNIVLTVCDSIKINYKNYYKSGFFIDTIFTNSIKDTILLINLNLNKSKHDTLKAETCNTYKFGDSTYSKSGTYTHKYIAKNGCDSFRTLVLTSKEVSGKIKLENGINYTALTPNASYQWYYCYPWRRITNAQNQTFSTTTKGSYAVVVSSLGCTDTSDCVALYSSGIQSLNQNQIQLFPNPIQDNFTIQFGNEYKENSVEIYNALGQKIKSFNTKLNEIQVEMKDESRGIYLIKVNEIQVYKIIKE